MSYANLRTRLFYFRRTCFSFIFGSRVTRCLRRMRNHFALPFLDILSEELSHARTRVVRFWRQDFPKKRQNDIVTRNISRRNAHGTFECFNSDTPEDTPTSWPPIYDIHGIFSSSSSSSRTTFKCLPNYYVALLRLQKNTSFSIFAVLDRLQSASGGITLGRWRRTN